MMNGGDLLSVPAALSDCCAHSAPLIRFAPSRCRERANVEQTHVQKRLCLLLLFLFSFFSSLSRSLQDDNKLLTTRFALFQDFVVMDFPRESLVGQYSPSSPQSPTFPRKTRKLYYYCLLTVSDSLQCPLVVALPCFS